MRDIQLIIGGGQGLVIEHIPHHKVEQAKSFVDECASHQRGFCYKRVVKIPLASGRNIRQEMVTLKRERMNAATIQGRADRITERLVDMRKTEREHYQYDVQAYRTLRSNYDKLKRCLDLLCEEGEVEAYTLTGEGHLSIKWWTVHQSIHLQVVEQGWTFDREKAVGVVLARDAQIHVASHPNHGIYFDDGSWGTGPATKGSGEYPVDIVKTHNQNTHNVTADNKALYENGRLLREWFIAVMAYYTPADKLGKVVNTYV
jgi:hypothetical protein